MLQWYRGIDVLLCTSSSEGTPLPVFEAASCGRPVISTTVGAVAELITHEENGFLLGNFTNRREADAVVDRAEACIDRLAADNDLLQRMSRRIRSTVEAKFTWQRLSVEWLQTLTTSPNGHS